MLFCPHSSDFLNYALDSAHFTVQLLLLTPFLLPNPTNLAHLLIALLAVNAEAESFILFRFALHKLKLILLHLSGSKLTSLTNLLRWISF